MKELKLIAFLAIIFLSGCAATYDKSSWALTGPSVKHLDTDVYRVTFQANGYTTFETIQTYWLYRCANLAIEKGYQGFEILSNINLTQDIAPEELFNSNSLSKHVVMVFVVPQPAMQADIRLIKGSLKESPPRIFIAEKLIASLKPIVEGKKCKDGNICQHPHTYLYPSRDI